MVAVAATLFGLNGAVSKVALTSGLSSLRLTEARSAGACIALTAIALARAPSSLRVQRRELPRLAIFGIVGVAFVQLFYFLAIHRLPVGALVLWVIVLGSAVPFTLIVGAMRHITATQVGITAMLEPVVATVVAWIWLRESLSAAQLAGAAVVLCAIGLAQTAR